MNIHGFNTLTLLDYPGHMAATVFTGCCNFRCPFCQNASLVLHPETEPVITEQEVLKVLQKRKGILEGICVTGGEPTLQADLPDFIRSVKELGFLVKLDTNGTNPTMVEGLIADGLIDFIAMDIKTSKEDYRRVSGCPSVNVPSLERTIALMKNSGIDYEFRTTVVDEFHSEKSFADIVSWIGGGKAFYLQNFEDSGDLIESGLHAASEENMKKYLKILEPHFEKTGLRGIK